MSTETGPIFCRSHATNAPGSNRIELPILKQGDAALGCKLVDLALTDVQQRGDIGHGKGCRTLCERVREIHRNRQSGAGKNRRPAYHGMHAMRGKGGANTTLQRLLCGTIILVSSGDNANS